MQLLVDFFVVAKSVNIKSNQKQISWAYRNPYLRLLIDIHQHTWNEMATPTHETIETCSNDTYS